MYLFVAAVFVSQRFINKRDIMKRVLIHNVLFISHITTQTIDDNKRVEIKRL